MYLNWLERRHLDAVEGNEAVAHAGGLVLYEAYAQGEGAEREVCAKAPGVQISARLDPRLGTTAEFRAHKHGDFSAMGYWQMFGDYVAVLHYADGQRMGTMAKTEGVAHSLGDIMLALEELAREAIR